MRHMCIKGVTPGDVFAFMPNVPGSKLITCVSTRVVDATYVGRADSLSEETTKVLQMVCLCNGRLTEELFRISRWVCVL